MGRDYKDSEVPCWVHVSWNYTGTFLSMSGKRQVQHKAFTAFILLKLVQWAHSLEPLQAKETNRSIKDKAAAPQLCFAYMVLGLTPLVGKRGLLCPRKPPWDFLWGTIPVIRYEQGHQIEKVFCQSDTRSRSDICYWPWEEKPQCCVLESSESYVLDKRLLPALRI